jgi:hypothetical protein
MSHINSILRVSAFRVVHDLSGDLLNLGLLLVSFFFDSTIQECGLLIARVIVIQTRAFNFTLSIKVNVLPVALSIEKVSDADILFRVNLCSLAAWFTSRIDFTLVNDAKWILFPSLEYLICFLFKTRWHL